LKEEMDIVFNVQKFNITVSGRVRYARGRLAKVTIV